VDGSDREMEGTVAFISPKAEFTPTNVQTDEQRAKLVYRVKVTAANQQGVLKVGMPVEVTLAVEGDRHGTGSGD
jgi:HlyD family secretion protein